MLLEKRKFIWSDISGWYHIKSVGWEKDTQNMYNWINLKAKETIEISIRIEISFTIGEVYLILCRCVHTTVTTAFVHETTEGKQNKTQKKPSKISKHRSTWMMWSNPMLLFYSIENHNLIWQKKYIRLYTPVYTNSAHEPAHQYNMLYK